MPLKEMKKLLDGNKNFINGTPKAENKCLMTLKRFKDYQEPHAIILSCSDSRVVPELIFDVGIGELFVVRTAGTTLGKNTTESIEFALKKMNIPLLVVLGHDDCGVVKYAVKNPDGCDVFPEITSQVHEVINYDVVCYNELAKRHTLNITMQLKRNSRIIKEAIEKGDLTVVSAHFHFDTGEVTIINTDE